MTSILTFSLLYCINHGAVPLFSNRSGMRKCSKNGEVAHKPLGECITDSFLESIVAFA